MKILKKLLCYSIFPLHLVFEFGASSSLAVVLSSATAATTFVANRASIDRVVGLSQANGPAIGYEANTSETNLVGVTGSSAEDNRFNQVLIYRYELPTLSPGEVIQSFDFDFQITQFRDHANQDFRLNVYLLDAATLAGTGADFYFHGPSDSSNSLVGDAFIASGTETGNITPEPPLDVNFTINSGSAFDLLTSFYNGNHVPEQTHAFFRFNLDQTYLDGSNNETLASFALNRYIINPDASTSNFSITTIPEPSVGILGVLGTLFLLNRRRF